MQGEFVGLFFVFFALCTTFIAACHIPWGLDRSHGVCSVAGVVCGVVAVIFAILSAAG